VESTTSAPGRDTVLHAREERRGAAEPRRGISRGDAKARRDFVFDPTCSPRLRVSAAIVLLCVAASASSASAQEVERLRPSFRTGVELVSLDVNVVDRNGRPLDDLHAADFVVNVDGQPRRVVSATFIGLAAPGPKSAKGEPIAPLITTNASSTVGRMVALVVDQSTLTAGESVHIIRAASNLLDRLTPSDRVALLSLPLGPRVEFTGNIDLVRRALQRVVGQNNSFGSMSYGISLSEARSIANGEMWVLETVVGRECPRLRDLLEACRREIENESNQLWQNARSASLASVNAFAGIVDVLGEVPGDKTIVLLSGGWPLEENEAVSMLGAVANQASLGRLTVFSLFIPENHFDVARRFTTLTPMLDDNMREEALDILAGMTRGTTFKVSGSAAGVFDRLARELSGFYRLGVEPTDADRDGRGRVLKVQVRRKGTTVRARSQFAVDPTPDTDKRSNLRTALTAPLPFTELTLRFTSYVAAADAARNETRVLVAGDVAGAEAGDVRMAFVVFEGGGRTVASGDIPLTADGSGSAPFSGTVVMPPGRYTLRLAAVDGRGRVGSADRQVDAIPVKVGTTLTGDLMLARLPAASGASAMPVLEEVRQDERLAAHIEVAKSAGDAKAVFEVARSTGGPALLTAPAQVDNSPERSSMTLVGVVEPRLLPPGEYVARARLAVGGKEAGTLVRPFRVTAMPAPPVAEATTTASAKALPALAVMKSVAVLPPFRVEHVLDNGVLSPFLDELSQRPDAQFTAVQHAVQQAKQGGVRQLSVDDAIQRDAPVAGDFLRGLKLLSEGKLDEAANRFRGAMRTSSDFYPAMVYLGACFAAGGKHREAAGAWRTALIREGHIEPLHGLLADALLRAGRPDSALEVIEKARQRWPEATAFDRRFITAALLTGRPRDAFEVLDAQPLDKPEMEPMLLVALQTLFQASASGRPLVSAEDDRTRLARYAEAYRRLDGPSLPLVEEWMKAVNR
jgi:VWFA-related protein